MTTRGGACGGGNLRADKNNLGILGPAHDKGCLQRLAVSRPAVKKNPYFVKYVHPVKLILACPIMQLRATDMGAREALEMISTLPNRLPAVLSERVTYCARAVVEVAAHGHRIGPRFLYVAHAREGRM